MLFWDQQLDFKEYELEADAKTHNCRAEGFTIPQPKTLLIQ